MVEVRMLIFGYTNGWRFLFQEEEKLVLVVQEVTQRIKIVGFPD
jgi:hypothetical protein